MGPACRFLAMTRINCRSGSIDPVVQRGILSKLNLRDVRRSRGVGRGLLARPLSAREGKFGRGFVTGWRLREKLLAARRGEPR
jgi:hypothetical protein